jgi:hypothetical protein
MKVPREFSFYSRNFMLGIIIRSYNMILDLKFKEARIAISATVQVA